MISLGSKSRHLSKISSYLKDIVFQYYKETYGGLVGCIVLDIFLIITCVFGIVGIFQQRKKKKKVERIFAGFLALLLTIRIILGFIFILGNEQYGANITQYYIDLGYGDIDPLGTMAVAWIYECILLVIIFVAWIRLLYLTRKKIN